MILILCIIILQTDNKRVIAKTNNLKSTSNHCNKLYLKLKDLKSVTNVHFLDIHLHALPSVWTAAAGPGGGCVSCWSLPQVTMASLPLSTCPATAAINTAQVLTSLYTDVDITLCSRCWPGELRQPTERRPKQLLSTVLRRAAATQAGVPPGGAGGLLSMNEILQTYLPHRP